MIRLSKGLPAVSIMLDDSSIFLERKNGHVEQADEEVLNSFEEANINWHLRDREGPTLLHVLAKHATERAFYRFKFLVEKKLNLIIFRQRLPRNGSAGD